MSSIDPSTRWWNRAGFRTAITWICWVLGAFLLFVAGWALSAAISSRPLVTGASEESASLAVPLGFTVGLPAMIAGIFLHPPAPDDRVNPRLVFLPLAVLLTMMGLGGSLEGMARGDGPGIPLVAVGAGVVGAIVLELVSRRLDRVRARRDRAARTGIRAVGVVTRASGYLVNHSPVTRVTVQFMDAAGTPRWATQSIPGTFEVGARVLVRYSDEDTASGRDPAVHLG